MSLDNKKEYLEYILMKSLPKVVEKLKDTEVPKILGIDIYIKTILENTNIEINAENEVKLKEAIYKIFRVDSKKIKTDDDIDVLLYLLHCYDNYKELADKIAKKNNVNHLLIICLMVVIDYIVDKGEILYLNYEEIEKDIKEMSF